MKKFAESDFITIDDVKASPTKTIVFINPGEEKLTDFGHKLRFMVEMDGKRKYITLNRTSVQNIIDAFGPDSNVLIGKRATLKIETFKSRESVVVYPIKAPSEETVQ